MSWRDDFDLAQTPQGAASALRLLPVYNVWQPAWAIGNIAYADTTSTLARLAPNTTTTQMFLSMTGTGSAGAAPVWASFAEAAQDAVGGILVDSSTIDFTYDDAAPSITAIVIDDSITDAKLRNSAAVSVIGRSANSSGDPGDIAASANGNILRRASNAVGFGTIDLSDGTNAVSNQLAVANGGSGAATLTGLLQGNGTSAFTAITNSTTVGQVLRVTGSNTYAWGALDLADSDAITGDLPFSNLTQGSALSVLGVTGNATADHASIAAGTDNQVLRRSGTSVAFGAVNLASSDAVTGDLPYANLAQGSALSVLGVTGNATADNASIAAGSDHQVLRRSGTAVAFGAVNLAQSNAVTGDLPFSNLAQGSAFSVLGVTGNATADNASIAASSNGHVLRRASDAVGFGQLTTDYIQGRDSDSAAASGFLGYIDESSIASGSAVSISPSGTVVNVTTRTLGPGTWLVWGNVAFAVSVGTTALRGAISTTSATFPTLPNAGATAQHNDSSATAPPVFPVGMRFIRVANGATTTVYLVARADFASGTVSAYGYLAAILVG